MTVSEGKTSGKLVIEAENVSKSFGERPDRQGFFDTRCCGATVSASSGRMAPARPRCSIS